MLKCINFIIAYITAITKRTYLQFLEKEKDKKESGRYD